MTHLRAQIACYELNGYLRPVMLKAIFHEGFENFQIGKPCKRDWMAKVVFLIQMLPTFGGRCNRYFWDIRLKILGVPNFNMLFQLLLNCFRVHRKLITWSSHATSLFNLSWAICEQFKPKKPQQKPIPFLESKSALVIGLFWAWLREPH